MKNLTLSSRLALGFGLVLALLAAVAAIGISRMAQINHELDNIININNAEARLAVAMRLAVTQMATASRNVVLVTDEEGMKAEAERVLQIRADYDAAEAKLGQMFESIAETSAEEKAMFARIKQLKMVTRPLVDKVVALGRANRNEEATTVLMKEVRGPQREWLQALGELADFEDKMSEKAAADAHTEYKIGRAVMLASSFVALLMGIGAAVLITRSIVRQLGGEPGYATDVVRRIAGGDLSAVVAVKTGDTTSLLAAMKAMQQSLATVVDNIRSGSDSIATGSGQIASGNADLSQRTEEQASNLQQTAASMEQLTGTVKNSADTARQANALANSASAVAGKGGEVVGKVVHTMEEISAASKRIGDIIGVIDGIAFRRPGVRVAPQASPSGLH